MLRDCNYDKIKLLHKMSALAWFLEKHAKDNAQKENDSECRQACVELQKDLEKHIEKFKKLI